MTLIACFITVICIYNVGTALAMIVFPLLFWYNCYSLGAVRLTAIVLSFVYLCASYFSFEIMWFPVRFSYYAIFDTIAMWKFVIRNSRTPEVIEV